jgi:hypothetical protein
VHNNKIDTKILRGSVYDLCLRDKALKAIVYYYSIDKFTIHIILFYRKMERFQNGIKEQIKSNLNIFKTQFDLITINAKSNLIISNPVIYCNNPSNSRLKIIKA